MIPSDGLEEGGEMGGCAQRRARLFGDVDG